MNASSHTYNFPSAVLRKQYRLYFICKFTLLRFEQYKYIEFVSIIWWFKRNQTKFSCWSRLQQHCNSARKQNGKWRSCFETDLINLYTWGLEPHNCIDDHRNGFNISIHITVLVSYISMKRIIYKPRFLMNYSHKDTTPYFSHYSKILFLF